MPTTEKPDKTRMVFELFIGNENESDNCSYDIIRKVYFCMCYYMVLTRL